MTAQPTRKPAKKTSRWPLITSGQRAAIVSHLERMLEMALARQAKSALFHERVRDEGTRKSMEYDTAAVATLKWSLYHARRRPVTEE